MRQRARIFGLAVLSLALAAHAADAPTAVTPPPAVTAKPVSNADVLAFLDQLMEWQRDAFALTPAMDNARERIFRESLQQSAVAVLQSGFAFARAEAALAETDTAPPDPKDPRQRVLQRAEATNAQIANIDRQLPTANGTKRQALQDERKLAVARRELLATVLGNMNAANATSAKGLQYRIDNLARSIPDLNTESKTAAKAEDPAPQNTHSSSIIGLAETVFDITRAQRDVDRFAADTGTLKATTRATIQRLRDALEKGDVVIDHATIDQQVALYKQIGAAIVPLGQANLGTIAAQRTLADWRDVLDREFSTAARQLAIRAALLAFTLAIPLVISEAVHRTSERYVREPKRRRQLNIARRIVTGIVLLFILLLTFISDFGSFATFAGFMTAGLAVALQSVLLALVAHFFFYGRYGVRSGDRVNVNGVTGDILSVGMVRFYMRELKEGENGDFVPTGKIVAFPNSILFQSTAFYKYE